MKLPGSLSRWFLRRSTTRAPSAGSRDSGPTPQILAGLAERSKGLLARSAHHLPAPAEGHCPPAISTLKLLCIRPPRLVHALCGCVCSLISGVPGSGPVGPGGDSVVSVLGNSHEPQAFPEPLLVSLGLILWESRVAICNFHPGLHSAKPQQHSPIHGAQIPQRAGAQVPINPS